MPAILIGSFAASGGAHELLARRIGPL